MHEMRSEICILRSDDDMILMTRACVMCHVSCEMSFYMMTSNPDEV